MKMESIKDCKKVVSLEEKFNIDAIKQGEYSDKKLFGGIRFYIDPAHVLCFAEHNKSILKMESAIQTLYSLDYISNIFEYLKEIEVDAVMIQMRGDKPDWPIQIFGYIGNRIVANFILTPRIDSDNSLEATEFIKKKKNKKKKGKTGVKATGKSVKKK
jgi:hypothetical protein